MTVIKTPSGYTATARACNGVIMATASTRNEAITLLMELMEDASC